MLAADAMKVFAGSSEAKKLADSMSIAVSARLSLVLAAPVER